MGNRKSLGNSEQSLLYNEVNGLCPECLNTLMKGSLVSLKENAHCYPLNATKKDKELLEGVEEVEDLNSLDNFIALCPTCHSFYDKSEKKKELYDKYKKIKINAINTRMARETYFDCNVKEIKALLEKIYSELKTYNNELLDSNALNINKKFNKDFDNTIMRDITQTVLFNYTIVNKILEELSQEDPELPDAIAQQIHSAYFTLKRKKIPPELIYKSLIEMLSLYFKDFSEESCKIIICYYIQRCEVFEEVFEDVSK